MILLNRRAFALSVAAAAGAVLLPSSKGQAQGKILNMLLNTSLSGPVSFFLLAEDRGYLKEEGLAVRFSAGGGAAVVVPQVRHGDYDVGYGDITALIERIARGPKDKGPVAVYTTFNRVPFTIAVPASSLIRAPKDLEGKRIIGHGTDAALITFDMFAAASGIDASKVRIEKSFAGMGSQVADMLSGQGADAAFGFVNTIIASVAAYGIDGAKQLRFINYADHLLDMYGNTLFVTRELHAQDRAAITALVRAFNRGLADTVARPDDAIEALAKRGVSTPRAVDRTRLIGTLKSEMAHPEGERIGIGDMDEGRLARLIALTVRAKNLPRTPAVGEVFDRRFLPPVAQRIRSLGKAS